MPSSLRSPNVAGYKTHEASATRTTSGPTRNYATCQRFGCRMLATTILLALSLPPTALAEPVGIPPQEAYEKVLSYILDLGAVPVTRDDRLLYLKTDPLPTRLTTEEADCGSMFGIPYLKDKRTKTAVAYQVRVKKVDEQSSDINVRITVTGHMDTMEGAPFFVEKTRDTTKALICKSTGLLEQRLLQAVGAKQ